MQASSKQAAVLAPLERLSPQDPRWRRFAGEHPDALGYHQPGWMAAIEACYGFPGFVLAAVDDDGAIEAGLPVMEVRLLRRRPRWASLPFTDQCPPLLGPNVSLDRFTAALDAARITAGLGELAVRAPLAEGGNAHFTMNAVLHTTALGGDPDQLFGRLHKSQVQRNIKRGQRDGAIVVRGEGAAALVDTYYALHVRTRKRHGMPVQPRRFFQALWDHVLEPGGGSVVLAYDGERPVAGAVLIHGPETVTYKYGASDDGAWRLRPNHLVLWEALRSACEQGYRLFDFGRSDLDGAGLREFKSGWAAKERPLIATTLAAHAPQDGSGRGLAAVQAVLRRSPAWAGRAAGELLYRFTA